jgi:hypothetical protein
MDLFITIFLGRLGLVETHQITVVALAQSVVFGDFPAFAVFDRADVGAGRLGLVERQLRRPARPGQGRSVDPVEVDVFQQPACIPGLGFAISGQIHVFPASEAVFHIPLTLTVPQQNQVVHHAISPLRTKV